ncbi:MAG: general secretion pathway protein GspG [Candidatus Aminicenantes bacterium RBG_16_63_14]|nr:MAG: general secretion pathway protein GspG [Candidatus Aminicenantes bacterium RBG_16_63_14]OGD25860.1 MAG: general secretion pathway protein GspG [Candidatus Aminicenantes bacterium RBG_19FT_COMBO_65_30]
MMLRKHGSSGFTIAEMIITLSLLAILALSALPLSKIAVKRENEIELQRALRLMREAIDAYKKLADEKKTEVDEDTEGYPPTLEALVKGVEVQDKDAKGQAGRKKMVKFLRRIPKDPMTNSFDWGLRSYQDDPDSDIWGEENVYDVYTKSQALALDGTRYRDW